jgi:RNA polymerase sigma-70 factor, ECF subfamily
MTKDEFIKSIVKMEDDLLGHAIKLTKDWEEALDLKQEAMYKAIAGYEQYKEDTNLKGWLHTILRNTFINDYRKQRLKNEKQDNFYDLRVEQVADNKAMSPESILNMKEIEEAMSRLVPGKKKTFKLFLEGYKYEEIAEELDIPIGTVKARIFYARKTLMEILNG